MKVEEIMKLCKSLEGLYEKAFINMRFELIIEPKHNIYFRLDNITSELEFKCKVLEYTSRACIKGVSSYYQKYFTDRIRSYFDYPFTKEELIEVYTYVGGGVNREKCIKYIESDFDMGFLL